MMLAANVVVSNIVDSLFGALVSVWPQLVIAAGVYASIIMAARIGFGGLWNLAKRLGQIIGLPIVIDHGRGKLSEDAVVAAIEESRVRKNRDTGDALWLEGARADSDQDQEGLTLMNDATGNAAWWDAAQSHAGLSSGQAHEPPEVEPGSDWRTVPYDQWTPEHHAANSRWWNSDDDDAADAA